MANGRPIGPLSPGAEGGWRAVAEGARRHGHVVCHGPLEEWARAAGCRPRALLGADWPRYLTARDPAVRARLSGSRLLLRQVVAAVAGTAPERVRLERDPRGRPVLAAPGGLDVGISHTAGMLVVGVAHDRLIGVDVEARDRPLVAPGLAERFCHPDELARLHGLSPAERNARLVRLWTLKEAYTKALGVGLAADFRHLDVGGPTGGGAAGWRLRCDGVTGGFLVARALGPA
ncbi:4'-phosphopantetheinyl transferase superfamily protein [Streptomyces sp. B93]|uniref:4'-phosphopantetheinyl transferase family protein n=1 Tax=Streptomyces sp. B93 TaxID=2824875 RepID=UPI001B3837F9|nr:4'-phosphopantetheinyl transferase superfamily protein [Streptomyces sp. B93]MBQ1089979.1 4'-phosphopantetheinyl transferase superfamily protein [Streptomyces sp. B93]